VRVLVIGGTSFIGPHVVRGLVSDGHRVAVFHRGDTETELPVAVEHIHGDRLKLAAHVEAFERFAPDVLLHMVAMTERQAQVALEVFAGRVGRIVAISSADVYRARNRLAGVEPGPPDPIPLREGASLRSVLYPYRETASDPSHPSYGYDKIPVERVFMQSADVLGTVLRLPFVYGPGDRQHRTAEYLRRMDGGEPAIRLGEEYARWRSTRGYVENVAAAIVLAIRDERAAGKVYNVGDEPALAEAEWVREVGKVAGWSGKVITVPEGAAGSLPGPLPVSPDWRQGLVLDTARIRRELGYGEVVSFAEGLRRTIEWERSHTPGRT
jgi:nucleoside-diphosphate-sugar epimerase